MVLGTAKLTSESSTSLKLTDGGSGLELLSTTTCSLGFDLLKRGAFSLLKSSLAEVARASNAGQCDMVICDEKERPSNSFVSDSALATSHIKSTNEPFPDIMDHHNHCRHNNLRLNLMSIVFTYLNRRVETSLENLIGMMEP